MIGTAAISSIEPGRGRGGAAWRVEALSAAAAETIEPQWRALLARSTEASPFMSPDFLLPAAIHQSGDGGPDLAAIWEDTCGTRSLAGLFALRSGASSAVEGWTRPRSAALWRHPMQPSAAPLLDGDDERARRAVGAFLDWAAAQSLYSGFEGAGLAVGCAAARLLVEEARARHWPVSERRDAERTRGMHFMPDGLHAAVERVAIAAEPQSLRAAVERLLCLDGQASPRDAILLRDPLLPSLLRAAVRGFGREGRAVIATTEGRRGEAGGDPAGAAEAGGLFLLGRDRAYLWRLFGAGAEDPAIEAALAVAVHRRFGMPVAAASTQRLAGVGSAPMPTQSLSIGFHPEPPAFMRRMRVWMASGLFG